MDETKTKPNQSKLQPTPRLGKPVKVDVYARPGRRGGATFKHDWAWDGEPTKHSGDIKLPKRPRGERGTPIHFHLHDDTDLGLRFDPADPIWVLRDVCPQRSFSDPQIPRAEIEVVNARHLKILDVNSEECELGYNLRFQKKDGKPEGYDPRIINGGD